MNLGVFLCFLTGLNLRALHLQKPVAPPVFTCSCFLLFTGRKSDLQECRYNRHQSQIWRQIMHISHVLRAVFFISVRNLVFPFKFLFILFRRTTRLYCSTALNRTRAFCASSPLFYCETCTVCKDFISIWSSCLKYCLYYFSLFHTLMRTFTANSLMQRRLLILHKRYIRYEANLYYDSLLLSILVFISIGENQTALCSSITVSV